MPVASSSTTVFTEADFDGLSWHDNPIYGFFIDNDVTQWKSDLVFDIDFIVEWLCGVGSKPSLRSQLRRSHSITSPI